MGHLDGRLRAVLRGAEQRRAEDGRSAGHPGDGRADQRSGWTSTTRSGCSTRTTCATPCRATSGTDYYYQLPVEVIMEALPVTVSLASAPACCGSCWGSSTACSRRSARVRGRSRARPPWRVVLLLDAVVPPRPAVAVLPLLQAHLAGFDWFPAAATRAVNGGSGRGSQHLFLPWIALVVLGGHYTRLTRGSMLDVLGEDYIRTARGEGHLGRRRVIVPPRSPQRDDAGRHAVRHRPRGSCSAVSWSSKRCSASPASVGPRSPPSTSQRPTGRHRHRPLRLRRVVLTNILVDITYAILDPRVRLN